MPRGLGHLTLPHVRGDVVRPRILVDADLGNIPVKVWTGNKNLYYDHNGYGSPSLFYAAGSALSFDNIEENNDLGATGFTLSLALSQAGTSSDILQKVIDTTYRNRPIVIYLAFVDENEDIIPNLVILFDGYTDSMSVRDDGDTATITLQAESNLLLLRKARKLSYTHEDQLVAFPGDMGLEFVASIQEKVSVWGTES